MLDDIARSREGAVFGYIVVCRDRHPQFVCAYLRSRRAAQAFTGYNSAAWQGKYRMHNEIPNNLPVLQAGMLGYPVIATNIEPYRTLPVTRLPNTPLAWISAIRNRIERPAALRREGETLRRAVHANFLVETWTHRYFELWTGTSTPSAHA
jgi:hypothetical protein